MRWRGKAALLLVGGLSALGPASAQGLPEAVELALDRVPSLAAARATALASEAGVRAALAGYLPTLDLTLGGHYGWRNEPTVSDRFATDYFESEATLTLRQRVFDGGATASAVAAAEDAADAAGFAAELAAEELASAVAAAYLNAYEGEAAVGIAAASLRDLRRLLGLVGEQEAAGLLTPADRRQLEGRVALAEAELAATEGRRQVAAARLAALTGEPLSLLVLPTLPTDRLPPGPASALERALRASPWLAEAAALERARQAERGVGAAQFWPIIDLVVAGRIGDGINGVEGQVGEALVLVELRWTLFDGYGREAELRRLSHLIAAAHGELLDRRRQLAGRIGVAYATLAEAASQLPPLDEAVAAARATWRLYGEQFAIGRRTLLELLDARRELARLEQQRLRVELQGPRAAFDLGAALGELRAWLRPQNVTAAPPAWPAQTVGPALNVATATLLAGLGASDLPSPVPRVPAREKGPVLVAAAIAGKLGAGPNLSELTAALPRQRP